MHRRVALRIDRFGRSITGVRRAREARELFRNDWK
jgi:hypothetical protein